MSQSEEERASALAKEKSDNRAMIIVSVVIVAFILAIMGLNVMFSEGGGSQTPAESPPAAATAPQTPPPSPQGAPAQ